jgi:ribosomal protein L7/L12
MPAMEYEVTELRQRIAHLEGQVAFLYNHLGITFTSEAAPGDDPRIVEQITKGNMIEAIKIYRDLHKQAGLADAKRAVEEIRSRRGL